MQLRHIYQKRIRSEEVHPRRIDCQKMRGKYPCWNCKGRWEGQGLEKIGEYQGAPRKATGRGSDERRRETMERPLETSSILAACWSGLQDGINQGFLFPNATWNHPPRVPGLVSPAYSYFSPGLTVLSRFLFVMYMSGEDPSAVGLPLVAVSWSLSEGLW